MKDQVLSVQQMLHLQLLGIDISNASMAYQKNIGNNEYKQLLIASDEIRRLYADGKYPSCMPTFTLNDMIVIMPEKLEYHGRIGYLSIQHYLIEYRAFKEFDSVCMIGKCYPNVMKNAYSMLVWLAENNYLNKSRR